MKHIKLYEQFGVEAKLIEAKYKGNEFAPKPVQVGEIYFDYPGKPGTYNYRKIVSIEGDRAEVEIWDLGYGGKGHSLGNKHTVALKDIQDKVDTIAKEQYDKNESVNKLAHDLSEEIKLNKLKGGDLSKHAVVQELKSALANLKLAAEKFTVASNSIPAGGFSGANSSTMHSSRSGQPVQLAYNDVHRGGTYGFNTEYIVQIRVGGALPFNMKQAILKVAGELLTKYEYTTDLGKSSFRETDGTNWSSVMLTAPTKNNSWSPLRALEA